MAINPEKNFDIKNLTSFKIGTAIDEVFFPENLVEFEQILTKDKNIKVFGNLSNTLISSSGISEKIILTTRINTLSISGCKVSADAGVKGSKLAQEVYRKGLSGLEFMIGFPGTVGGEVFINASANGQSVSDKLTAVTCYSKTRGVIKLLKDEMGFGYRTSCCEKDGLAVLQAEFELDLKDEFQIKAKMDENLIFRKSHQPSLNLPNCGSIFKNPQGESAGRLLDSIGAKGLSFGGVRVWDNHANFIVNDRNGTSLDVLELMYIMYKRVKERYNIELEPEIRFLGGNNKRENELCKILYKIK